MALSLNDRFEVPAAWSDINDPFPGPDEWADFFDSVNDLAAQDTQGARADRPAAVPLATTGGARGGWYWATDGTAAGSAKDLARSDGAAWYSVALLAARADFTAGVTVAADAAAQGTAAYAPLGVTRGDAAGSAFLAFFRDTHANRPALGVGAADELVAGLATNLSDLTVTLALKTNGELDVVGADHRFGASARGAAGTQIHLGSRGDAANAYLGAEGSATNVSLILRGQGGSGTIVAQPDASTTAATFSATAVTLAKPTSVAGALSVAGAITSTTGSVSAAAGDLRTIGVGGIPRLYLKATDSPADAKVWDLLPTSGGLLGRLINDAESVAATWLTVSRSGTTPTSIALGARLNVDAGGVNVVGSPTGYSDELRFASTGSGASHAISTLGTGSPILYFDHRGASGSFVFRNGVAAAVQLATLGATGNWHVAGDLGIQQLKALRDTTSSSRMLYHDAANVYLGEVDGARSTIVRAAGVDVLQISGSVAVALKNLTVNTADPALKIQRTNDAQDSVIALTTAAGANATELRSNTSYTRLWNWDNRQIQLGINNALAVQLTASTLAAATATTHLGAGALGASGAVLTTYADAGAADVWLYARAQDLATWRNLEVRALNTRFWDDAGTVQAKVGKESDLFSLDTSLFARWRDGTGNTFALSQVRLATGASIRTGAADSLFFLRMS